MSCGMCVHSRPAICDEDDDVVLKCHRYPAQIYVFNGEVRQEYPEADEPCGEYQGPES